MKFFGSINPAIKTLIFTNVAINMADGFLAPIFAIFVTQKIAPGELKVTGFAIATYWLVKSILQLPFAKFLDKTDGERDDYVAMVFGGIIFVLTPLAYTLVQTPIQLYLTQAFLAIGGTLYVVPWSSIFTRHVDRFRIGFEWSLNSSVLGFGLMAANALGGLLTEDFGFNIVFYIAAVFNFIGFLGLLFLKRYIKQRTRLEQAFPEHQRK